MKTKFYTMITSQDTFLLADEKWRKGAKGINPTGQLNPDYVTLIDRFGGRIFTRKEFLAVRETQLKSKYVGKKDHSHMEAGMTFGTMKNKMGVIVEMS